MGQGNPGIDAGCRMKGFESSPEEKYSGVLVDERLDVSQQCVLIDQKTSCIPGYITRSLASRSEDMILLLYSTLE